MQIAYVLSNRAPRGVCNTYCMHISTFKQLSAGLAAWHGGTNDSFMPVKRH